MPPIAMDRFRQELSIVYQGKHYAPATWKKMRQVLKELAALPGVNTTADLTTAQLAAWLATKTGSPNTINGLIDYCRGACSYAIEQGYLERAPSYRRLRLRAGKTRLNRPLTYQEAAALLRRLRDGATDWEGRRLYALFSLILLTGLRRDEALYSQVQDLDLAGRLFTVVERGRRLKTAGSARVVPLPESLVRVLREWLNHVPGPWIFPGIRKRGPWTGGTSGRSRAIDQLQAAAAAEKIGRVTWHGLRHTFGSHSLLYHQLPLWLVQRVMGHREVRTTQRYLLLNDNAVLAESVRSIGYDQTA